MPWPPAPSATIPPSRQPGRRLLAGAIGAVLPWFAQAQSLADCAALTDDARRLACYDTFARGSAAPAAPADTKPAPVPLPVRNEPSALQQVATAPSGQGLAAADYLTKFWELEPSAKRGTFVVRTYQPNALLPAHYSNNINRLPASPTHPSDGVQQPYKSTEAALQLSLRAKVLEDALLPNADLWVAFSQKSIWQLWNSAESSPFRSSDYQPEVMYTVPISDKLGLLPSGWRWRMLQAGIAHESNGQPDPLSRSWNRAYLGTAFTRDDYALQAVFNHRLAETGTDDNPHITDYIGHTELSASWFPGVNTMQLVARTSFKSWSKGSLKLSWSHPVFSDKPDGLRWYVQAFTGYGETLLDYNHRQTSIGVGFTLFQL
ncbi:phospholipase A [Ideonella azotifigens]|uniref:Phospholipase A1 n=2 Tax=Ideonella azotifigens TaxID=513160 RepID=A0ABP3V9X5_9BURK|nr:phospholipase A [Ideonella azotifigens]MCD2344593.1 phospholipase A [Ideonella azotifigens]